MDITEKKDRYYEVLASFEGKYKISANDAFIMLKQHGCEGFFTLPEMLDILPSSYVEKYWDLLSNDRKRIDGVAFEDGWKMFSAHAEEGREARKRGDEDISDFNIFNLKNLYDGMNIFEIPIKEFAKDYFLCFQKVIENNRRGTPDKALQTLLQIYNVLLKVIRKNLIDELSSKHDIKDQLIKNMDNARNYMMDVRSEIGGAHHTELMNKLNSIKNKVNTYDAVMELAGVTGAVNDDPMMLFYDLVESSYGSNPIIKKGLAVYSEVKADEALYSQIFNQLEQNNETKIGIDLNNIGEVSSISIDALDRLIDN